MFSSIKKLIRNTGMGDGLLRNVHASAGRETFCEPGVRSLPANEITYCMGYWNFAGNTKRSKKHYSSLLPETMGLLRGANLIFYHDSFALCKSVEALARSNEVNIISRRRPVETLPRWDVALDAVRACQNSAQYQDETRPKDFEKEKGVAHFWRDLNESGPDIYRKMVAIWLSKIQLTNDIANENPFETRVFSWVDASVSRFIDGRGDWNYSKKLIVPGKISHYKTGMKMHGKALPLNASVLLGDRLAWNQFLIEFDKALPAALLEPYPHDEETIVSRFFDERRDLFRKLKRAPRTAT